GAVARGMRGTGKAAVVAAAGLEAGKAGKALTKSPVQKAVAEATEEASRLHHPWPKYLGGAIKQELEKLPKSVHDAYHSGLDKILPRQIRGGATEYYASLSAAEQAANFEKFKKYTKAFDKKYGTNLWDAAVREGA